MELDHGDVAWLFVSSALVLFMVPGLALFYGGMVRGKNVLNMLLMNLVCLGIVPIIWVTYGYTLALKAGDNSLIGTFDHLGLAGIGTEELLTVIFLMTFASIAPALISGAVADRMKFSAWLLFVPAWVTLVYLPVVFWVYGAGDDGLVGWLGARGSLDFAGGTAIHINAGVAALVMSILLGKRAGWPERPMAPHNLPLVLLGAGILWFGWFGFNAGSALAADGVAIEAFMNTFLAGSAGMLGWLAAERFKDGHFTTLGAASGVVAGLVAITPAAGFVSGMSGIVIGGIAGALCFGAVQLKYRFSYDDSLDVVGVHMVGGIVGGLLIGFLADQVLAGEDYGLFLGGDMALLVEQAFSIVVVMAYSGVVTAIIGLALKATIGLRVDDDVEAKGLDVTEHAERAYND